MCAEKQALPCALGFETSGGSSPIQPPLLTGSLEKQNPDVRPGLTNQISPWDETCYLWSPGTKIILPIG